jgi:hypothetical protein
MIKTRLFTCVASGLVALGAQSVVAQTGCPAASVISYVEGTTSNGGTIDEDRTHPEQALGAPQNDNTVNFVSLGYGGSLTLAFDGAILDGPGKDIDIYETSYASNDCESDGIERANIELSADGVNWFSAGSVCRDGSVDISDTGLAYVTQIRISNDASSTTWDGYDVDAVVGTGCAAVPNPGCYGAEVYDVWQGTKEDGSAITDPIRIDPARALGVPENDRSNGAANFFTLGNGGWIILKMGDAIVTDLTSAPDLRVYETTWGNLSCSSYPEYATVSVSPNGVNFYPVATVCQSGDIELDLDAVVPPGVQVSYVKIEADGELGTTEDFFDVDGVEALWGCTPVVEQPQPNGCYADCTDGQIYVAGTKKNGSALPEARTHADRANVPQYSDVTTSPENNNFVSLGYGGSIQLCFGGAVTNADGDDLAIIETSFGNPSCETYPEYADVWVSIDAVNWYFVETGCHNFNVDISDAVDASSNHVYLPYIYYVKIANNDAMTTTPDGFDVDGVTILSGPCFGTQGSNEVDNSTDGDARYAVTAYPNPTSGTVNFTFALPESGKATLELYNVNGQRVASLFSNSANADVENTISYDLSSLPNGIYISKLTTDDGVVTGKVMLSK